MAEQETAQPETEEVAPKKSGKKKVFIIVILLALLLGGGGTGGFFFWKHRAAKAAQAAQSKEEKKESHDADEKEVAEVVELAPFIVNLADRDEPKYLRMTVSLGLGEGAAEKPDPLFTTKVRNAILAIVTTKTSDQVLTVEGKAELRKEMLSAARSVVDKPSVHAIYITDFIVQL